MTKVVVTPDFLQQPHAGIDEIARAARAALRERQRWATKAPPVTAKPSTFFRDLLTKSSSPAQQPSKSSPLQTGQVVRDYKPRS